MASQSLESSSIASATSSFDGNLSLSTIDNSTSGDVMTLAELSANLKVLQDNTNAFFLVIMGIVVFLMQVGFTFLEAGAVRSKNTVSILMKNMMDAFIGALAYWSVGWALAYGPGSNGFIGESNFFSYNMDPEKNPTWFFQFVFAATSATIVSGSVAERCQFLAYFYYSTVITGVVYPVISHWVWDTDAPGWLVDRGFHDYAGSGVVHVTGGTLALIGCIIIGPRKGRFDANGRPNDMPGHSVPLAGLGGVLLVVCFLAFNGGSQLSISKPGDAGIVALAIINSIIGGSSGAIVALFVYKYILKQKWSYLIALNGGLTGMVSLCAGCNVYPVWAAIIVGGLGACLFLGIHYLMLYFRFDDPLDAVAVHLGGGSTGILCVHWFAYGKGIFWLGNTVEPWYLFGINVAGLVCIISWSVAWSLLIFYPLQYFGFLRIGPEIEYRGIDLEEHGEAAYPADAWVEMQYKHECGTSGIIGVMNGRTTTDAVKKVQSYNSPMAVMPTSATIMHNSKNTFGLVPDPKVSPSDRKRAGKSNNGFEDSDF